jgi:WD40 repeat protein
MGLSPDGSRVFVTGAIPGLIGSQDIATAAYDSATGAQLWIDRYDGRGGNDDVAGLAVAPDGWTVYVTGESAGANGDPGFVTIAYDSATGLRRWIAGFNGPPGLNDGAAAIAVTPDASTVVVTGLSYRGQFRVDFATVAYDADTGHRRWVRFYDAGETEIANQPAAIAVSPSGSTVFVTGESYVSSQDAYDYATVAYAVADGHTVWVARYDGPAGSSDEPRALAVSPGGGSVFVTGTSIGATTFYDYATVAYDARTGAPVWVERWDGPDHDADTAGAVAVSPGGSRLFVTGSTLWSGGYDYGTIAYDAATGQQLWGVRYAGPAGGQDYGYDVKVSPGESRVFVTGATDADPCRGRDFGTIGYGATTGKRLWLSRYDGAGQDDTAYDLAVSPGGSKVFVTGSSQNGLNGDIATVAYRTT